MKSDASDLNVIKHYLKMEVRNNGHSLGIIAKFWDNLPNTIHYYGDFLNSNDFQVKLTYRF